MRCKKYLEKFFLSCLVSEIQLFVYIFGWISKWPPEVWKGSLVKFFEVSYYQKKSSFYTKIHFCKKFEEKISSIFQKIWNSLGVFHILRKHHEGGSSQISMHGFTYLNTVNHHKPLTPFSWHSFSLTILYSCMLLNSWTKPLLSPTIKLCWNTVF